MHPLSKVIPILREDWRRFQPPPQEYDAAWYEENTKKYFELVPAHAPCLMSFALVGEVVWTPGCERDMLEFYSQPSNNGTLFQWPGGECVGVCPGTGQKVAPDGKTVHLLVANQMHGTATQGSCLNMLTRLMPRILTLEGYRAMLGPEDAPGYKGHITSTVVEKDLRTGEKLGAPKRVTRPMYPDVLRDIVSSGKTPERPMPACDAWEAFHASGRYLALERMLEDDSKNNFQHCTESCKLLGMDRKVGGPIKGERGGPSTYTREGIRVRVPGGGG